MRTLILGGVRSGKSRQAEHLAKLTAKPVTYIATAMALDDEMRSRIDSHRACRPADWQTVEEPYLLAQALHAHAAANRCVVVDCLTLWLTQLLCVDSPQFSNERDALVDIYRRLPGDVIVVSNETGLGIMPLDALSRRFCDEAGRLHQVLAEDSDRVLFMAAGLPLVLKGAAA
jgi:adenosylcobinamide kinase/adenosylcobinamide-phosphate guanylyltransferase